MNPGGGVGAWWPYLVVLAGIAIGLTVIAVYDPMTGAYVIAATLMLAAVFRLVLPRDQVARLAVRNRAVDVVMMAVFGLAIALVVVALKQIQ
ncbi:DUF3017 domain-containing protein [Rhizohabitans arisaemae]|uniref:DUF3017 domain-containing protein n=1 Tax=Rhizohabitans arisaemae TaxID=2720610 RepID=UPI0024B0F478|nr:DUF3017 domain-containing protein [Rhizohabitans arisaemae]